MFEIGLKNGRALYYIFDFSFRYRLFIYLFIYFIESSTPSWKECSEALEGVKVVVAGLVEFIQAHGSRKLQEVGHAAGHTGAKYKISMCRDLTLRGSCPRGANCTFAHSNEELEKLVFFILYNKKPLMFVIIFYYFLFRYRAKNRKSVIRNTTKEPAENHSPTEKSYPNEELMYTPPASVPVSVSTVVPIPRVGYECNPYVQQYPPTGGNTFQPPVYQQGYGTEMYNVGNMVLTGGQGGQVSFFIYVMKKC